MSCASAKRPVGRHGDGAGVEVDGAWWLLGGASVGVAVGDRAVLSVMVWRPGSERSWGLGWSHRSGTQLVGAADAYGVRPSVGFGLSRSETWLVERRCKRRRDIGRSEPRTQTALECRRQRGFIGIGTWSDFRWGVSLLAALVGRRRERRRDFGWSAARTRTLLG